MPRLPKLISTSLRRGADAAEVAASALDRTAGVMRRFAGDDRAGAPATARTATPAQQGEPTPRPLTDASPATRGAGQISNPKAARRNRRRTAPLGANDQ